LIGGLFPLPNLNPLKPAQFFLTTICDGSRKEDATIAFTP